MLTGLRSGDTSLEVRGDGISLQIPVRVRFPRTVSFGSGRPGTGGYTPELSLEIRLNGDQIQMEASITRALGGVTGILCLANEPIFDRGKGFLLPDDARPIATIVCKGKSDDPGAGFATIPAPPIGRASDGRTKIFYLQATFPDPMSRNGWSVSNAIRLELGSD